MGSFTIDMDRFITRAKKDINVVARKIHFEICKGVIMDTPAVTGRARGNWQSTIGTPASGELGKAHNAPMGGAPVQRLRDYTGIWTPISGERICLINNLPYIKRLNEGWSKQRGARFVEANVLRLGAIEREATP